MTEAKAAQELQFMAERIVEYKDELFTAFRACDPSCRGTVSKRDWALSMLEVLGPHCGDLLSPEQMHELFECWSLEEPVAYVRFLHRFQIRDGPMIEVVDRISAVLKVQQQV